MQPDVRDPAHLSDMLGAMDKIARYLSGKTAEDLQADEMLHDAVVRQFTVLGEAAARVSSATRASAPGIPWRSIVGLRNVVVHRYDEVDYDELWRAFVTQMPVVRGSVQALLAVVLDRT